MTNINFDNPYFLFIAIPLLALILIPFFITFRKQNCDKNVIASLILHLLMVVCVTLAAGGLTTTRVVTDTSVYVVADVSYSSHLNYDEIDEQISEIRRSIPKNAKMGVVCFGKDAVLHSALGEKVPSVATAQVDNTATDIYGALTYTADLFETNVIKHIVLITDARHTGGETESALSETLTALRQKDIYVNAIFVDSTLPSDQCEVQINDVQYVKSTYAGQQSQASVSIQSNTETTAMIGVFKGEEKISVTPIDLIVGVNDFTFDLDTSEAGSFQYSVIVEKEEDELRLNNEYTFTQEVVAQRKVLFVSANRSDTAQAKQLFSGDDIDLDVREYTATMEEQGRKLKVPTTIEDLCQYDQFVLSNINVPEQIDGYTQFIDNLNIAVSTYGKSLLTFGDLQLQAKTDNVEDLENLENILPVKFGMPDPEATLYGIVIDVSRSMNSAGKMDKAINAAKFLIEQFQPQDGIIIVSYCAHGEVVMSMRNATEQGKALANDILDGLTPVQGTYVAGGLERMHDEMNTNPQFANKQVILIGDSVQSSTSSTGTTATAVAKEMYADGICVSALNIDNEEDAGGFRKIATAGKGKYYKGFTEAQLKSVLENSMVENLMGTVVQTPTTVNILLPTDPVLEGIDSFNTIGGYICGETKGDAVVVLSVDYERESGVVKKIPLYSYRNCGNGRVGTFSSSLGTNWVTSFLDKSGAQAGMKFFTNVLNTNVPVERTSVPYLYTVETGANTSIEVIPSKLYQTTSVEVTLITPSEKSVIQTLNFDGSRHFGKIETQEVGRYDLQIKYVVNDTEFIENTTFTIPYVEEYDRFAGYSAGLLYDLVDERGVVALDGKDIDFKINEDNVETYVYSFVAPLMIACVALFVVDVCIRKLRWRDIATWFIRKNKTSKKGDKQ